MNMSYCRYSNTLEDLRDCIDDALAHEREEAKYSVSKQEIDAFRNIVLDSYQFLETTDLINWEEQCLDEFELDELCFKMEKGLDEQGGIR